MAERIKIPFKTSVSIELVAPIDVLTDDPLDFTDDGATCTFKVYDTDRSKEVLSAIEALGQTVWSVTNAGNFLIGDTVELDQDDGTIVSGTLTGVDPVAGTITSDTATTAAAAAGSSVRVRLGPQITMSEFGTARVDTFDWGFRGTLPSDHAGLKLDLDVDIESTFAGTGVVGGGLDLISTLCAVIKRVEDCGDC